MRGNTILARAELKKSLSALNRTLQSVMLKAASEDRDWTAAEKKDIERLQAKIEAEEQELAEVEAKIALGESARRNSQGINSGSAGEPLGVSIPDAGFANFGEFLQAVRQTALDGAVRDERLVSMAAGASAGVPSDGGFAVPSGYAAEIWRRANDTGLVASRCRRLPMTANTTKLPVVDESSRVTGSRFGGVRVYRTSEGETVNASKPKIDKLELTLEKLMGIGYATEELLADAPLMGELMASAFGEELAFTLDDEIIRGNGAGRCLGILNSPCRVTVPKESGQVSGTLLTDNVLKMWSRCWGRSRRNSVWFVNQDIEPQLYTMAQVVGTGGVPVFLPSGGVSAEPFSSLFGRPIIPIEQASSLGTEGDIILADMTQYLVYERSSGPRFDQSMHVRFLYDEMTFRITWRVNGQPVWKSALTPANGSSTLSPFVTLQSR